MKTEERETSEIVEEVSARRWAALLGVAIVIVALGYVAVIFVGGEALRLAPFGQQLINLRERLGEAIAPEPPSVMLRPLEPRGVGAVEASTSPIVAARPSLSPTVVAPAPDAPSVVTFTIEYENTTGVRLTGVQISDRIPSGATYVSGSASPTASFDGSQLVWNLGTLDPGQSGKVSFRVTTRREQLTNKAVMTSNEAPPSEVESTATTN